MKTPLLPFVSLVAVLLTCSAAAAPIWGSLNGSRMTRALESGSFANFRSVINANGGVVGSSTSTLTASYLDGVDVFFYGWAGTSSGVLSAAERSALQSFVNNGGTLIATADIYDLSSINSATSMFGFTHSYVGHGGSYVAPISSHEITQGISNIFFNTESTFTTPANSQTLFNNPSGGVFMSVMDASTGFANGKILVMGDHNILADYYGVANNALLYDNIVEWAQTPQAAVPEAGSSIALLFSAAVGFAAVRRRLAARS